MPDMVINICLQDLILSSQHLSDAAFYYPHFIENESDTQLNDQTCPKFHWHWRQSQDQNLDCWHWDLVAMTPWVTETPGKLQRFPCAAYSTDFPGRSLVSPSTKNDWTQNSMCILISVHNILNDKSGCNQKAPEPKFKPYANKLWSTSTREDQLGEPSLSGRVSKLGVPRELSLRD